MPRKPSAMQGSAQVGVQSGALRVPLRGLLGFFEAGLE